MSEEQEKVADDQSDTENENGRRDEWPELIYGESCLDRIFRLNYEEPIKKFLKKTNCDSEVGIDIDKIFDNLTLNEPKKYSKISKEQINLIKVIFQQSFSDKRLRDPATF